MHTKRILFNYSLNTLISNYTHIGFKKTLLNGEFRRAILGFYWNVSIINPAITLATLKISAQFLFSIMIKWGKIGIVVLDTSTSIMRRANDLFGDNYFIFNYWPPGLISNFFRVQKTWSLDKKNPNRFLTIPRALFIISSTTPSTAGNISLECKKFKIPAFCVVDSIADLSFFNYWIPSNTKSVYSLDFFVNYIAALIRLSTLDRANKFVMRSLTGLRGNYFFKTFTGGPLFEEHLPGKQKFVYRYRNSKHSLWGNTINHTMNPGRASHFSWPRFNPTTRSIKSNRPRTKRFIHTRNFKKAHPNKTSSMQLKNKPVFFKKSPILRTIDSPKFKDRQILFFKNLIEKNRRKILGGFNRKNPPLSSKKIMLIAACLRNIANKKLFTKRASEITKQPNKKLFTKRASEITKQPNKKSRRHTLRPIKSAGRPLFKKKLLSKNKFKPFLKYVQKPLSRYRQVRKLLRHLSRQGKPPYRPYRPWLSCYNNNVPAKPSPRPIKFVKKNNFALKKYYKNYMRNFFTKPVISTIKTFNFYQRTTPVTKDCQLILQNRFKKQYQNSYRYFLIYNFITREGSTRND